MVTFVVWFLAFLAVGAFFAKSFAWQQLTMVLAFGRTGVKLRNSRTAAEPA